MMDVRIADVFTEPELAAEVSSNHPSLSALHFLSKPSF